MGSHKRPYRAKTKGCYECSQRRVSCDKNAPVCLKCSAKGLQCSGLGLRYRFNAGVASRGKRIGKTMQDLCKKEAAVVVSAVSSDGALTSSPLHNSSRPNATTTLSSPCLAAWNGDFGSAPHEPIEQPRSQCEDGPWTPPQHLESPTQLESSYTIQSLCLIADRQGIFLNYYSSNIAQEMQAIDDRFNGWRSLVLPISLEDKVVMNAVLAASAFHMARKSRTAIVTARQSYTEAIQGLICRQEFTKYDRYVVHCNILAILVLLVSVMVTGSSDFPLLFQMLKCAVDAVGGVDDLGSGELAAFLSRQIKKFRVYASPLIDTRTGLEAIQRHALETFDCLQHCSSLYPEHSLAMTNIRDQIQQAFNIYQLRSLGVLDARTSIQLVEQFKQTAKAFPRSCASAEHTLIWASYIVAAESSLPEHQAFFYSRFQAFYRSNGFSNSLKALRVLQSIWGSGSDTSWVSIISRQKLFVM